MFAGGRVCVCAARINCNNSCKHACYVGYSNIVSNEQRTVTAAYHSRKFLFIASLDK